MTPDAPAGVCVLGSFMMDLAIRAPRRPGPGETVMGTSFEMFLGGKGFNQAVAAARAGAATSMVGRVGTDEFGERFLDALGRNQIDARHVRSDPEHGTGIGVPLVEDTGENSIVVIPRANHAVTPADIEAAADVVRGARVLLLQLELPLDTVRAAARLAKAAGVIVVLNPAPAVDDLDDFAGLIDVLVPNESEVRRLGRLDGDGDPVAVARSLVEHLGTAVVLTLGSTGAVTVDSRGVERFAAHTVDVVDTVGAGDAFCGTLGARLADGLPLGPATREANAAGALAVTRRGAEPSMPLTADVHDLLARQVPGDAATEHATAGADTSDGGT